MTTYMIRQDSSWKYTVSKWEMGATPVVVYTVTLGKRNTCNCMSGHNRGYCKHTDMVKKWIAKGMPFGEVES